MQIERIFTYTRRLRTTLNLRRSRFIKRTVSSYSALLINVVCLILCYSLIVPFYALTPGSRIVTANTVSAALPTKPGKERINTPHRAIQTAQKARWHDNEILVRFRQNVSSSNIDALLQAN